MALVSDRDKCAHLLRRFGLGASEAEVDYYLRDGLLGAIDRLLETGEDEGVQFRLSDLADEKGVVRVPQLVGAWVIRLMTTRRPLREKMTLFWHDHFATSASKVNFAPLMQQQNDLLRQHATGSFRTMLHEVSKDPAMLFWLDNQENLRGRPNENFAREVMELFTLGVDQGYTEEDVQEAARAFTGWAFRRAPSGEGVLGGAQFFFRQFQHDDGEKVVLGNRGNLSGEDVLNILLDQPRTAEYLTLKIWEWFVYPNPEPSTIAPFAKRFANSRLEISSLLRDIMKSSEFYSERAERAVVKNPVDFCISTLRQLGYGENVAARLRELGDQEDARLRRVALLPAQLAANSMKGMGMFLLYPPDVAGWEIGPGWISSATMVERIGWADRIFGAPQPGKPSLRYVATGLFQEDPTAEGIVRRLVSTFDAPIRSERMPVLVEAARKELATGRFALSANKAANAVARLIFAAPEFQFA
jgi:uncharacterized protein (DUF1800 family)